MGNREKGRANFVLDAATTEKVRNLLDRHEQQHGFRPSMSQLIGGLVEKEHAREGHMGVDRGLVSQGGGR